MAKKVQQPSQFIVNTVAAMAVVFWLASVIPILVRIVQQLPTNPNLSGFYTSLLYDLFLPLAVFILVAVFRRNKKGGTMLVENILIALIVWLGAIAVFSVSQMVLSVGQIALSGELSWWYFILMIWVVSVGIIAGGLGYAHKLGKW